MMYRAIFLAVVLHTLPGLAIAAPPVEGFPTLEELVARGCRDADTVVVAQVINLRVKHEPSTEVRTGDVRVLRALKGNPKNSPATVSVWIPVPLMTDAFPLFLENNTSYVMFFGGRFKSVPQILPGGIIARDLLNKTISLAESACRL